MNKFRFYFYISLLFGTILQSCSDSRYYISIDPNYQGWIYLIQSNEVLDENTFYPDSLGITYVPKQLFDKKAALFIQVSGKIVEDQLYKSYDVEFTSENGQKIKYTKFYFPLTNDQRENKTRSFQGSSMPEFHYLYYSEKIDRFRIAK